MAPLSDIVADAVSDWPVPHVSAVLFDATQSPTWATYGECDRVYPLMSVTKLLTSWAFLIAVEEGVFDLDAEVCSCHVRLVSMLPEGATVRQCLAHASGVGFGRDDAWRAPGERRVYSSYGFEVLAYAVECLADIPFPQYLEEAVCAPLGMTSTRLEGSAGHGAFSCVRDLLLFIHEVFSPSLLDASTVQAALSPQFPELMGIVPGYGMKKPCPWGLGFELHGLPGYAHSLKNPHWLGEHMPAAVVGHFGMSGTYLWLHPESQRAMVVLTDRDFGAWAKPLWQERNEGVWESMEALKSGGKNGALL